MLIVSGVKQSKKVDRKVKVNKLRKKKRSLVIFENYYFGLYIYKGNMEGEYKLIY